MLPHCLRKTSALQPKVPSYYGTLYLRSALEKPSSWTLACLIGPSHALHEQTVHVFLEYIQCSLGSSKRGSELMDKLPFMQLKVICPYCSFYGGGTKNLPNNPRQGSKPQIHFELG